MAHVKDNETGLSESAKRDLREIASDNVHLLRFLVSEREFVQKTDGENVFVIDYLTNRVRAIWGETMPLLIKLSLMYEMEHHYKISYNPAGRQKCVEWKVLKADLR